MILFLNDSVLGGDSFVQRLYVPTDFGMIGIRGQPQFEPRHGLECFNRHQQSHKRLHNQLPSRGARYRDIENQPDSLPPVLLSNLIGQCIEPEAGKGAWRQVWTAQTQPGMKILDVHRA